MVFQTPDLNLYTMFDVMTQHNERYISHIFMFQLFLTINVYMKVWSVLPCCPLPPPDVTHVSQH